MEKVIKVPNRKKKKQRNSNKIKNKWNVAILNNLNAESKNLSIKTDRNIIERTLSLNKVVQSHTALRFPTIADNITNKDTTEIMNKKKTSNGHVFLTKVWNIPYSNGHGNLDTEVIIQPSKCSDKSEICKALMKIITSYIVENISNNKTCHPEIDNKKHHITPFKYIDTDLIEESPSYELIQDSLYTKSKKSPFTTNIKGSPCSEDESPAHTYYPHRLNQ